MNVQTSGTALVDHLGRPAPQLQDLRKPDAAIPSLHPLDDPAEWLRSPTYEPPGDVDIAVEQKAIDQIYGTTRNGQSIMKLVWAGDREYWDQYYTEWNALGHPTKEPERWPIIRYGTIRDDHGRPIRHTFPPRWLILSRIEPEQYAATWKRESWVFAPEIRCHKQTRPDEPPPVFWMWYATVADHNNYCCGTARRNRRQCYGKYAPPAAIHDVLWNQARADQAAGNRPFEQVSMDDLREVLDGNNGYRRELAEMQANTDIFIENPLALIGVKASIKAGIDTPQKARNVVKDFMKRQMDRLAKKA